MAELQQPWMTSFSRKAIRVGAEIDQSGAVELIEVAQGGDSITAMVDSPSHGFGEVEIAIKVDGDGKVWVNGECTCQVFSNCKHVVAALYAAMRREPAVAAILTGLRIKSPAAKQSDLPSAVKDWLGDLFLAQTRSVDSEDYGPTVKDRLIYVLREPLPGFRGLTLETLKVRVLKRGGYGNGVRYTVDPYDVDSSPRFVRPSDQQIARHVEIALGDRSGNGYGDCRLHGPDTVEVLDRILRTGRCFWGNRKTEPLRRGDPRRARAAWNADSEGRQRATLIPDPPGPIVFGLPEPWYYDLDTNTVGPLKTDLPPGVAARWLDAPSIPAIQAEAINLALAERFPTLVLPQAQTLEVVELPVTAPIARLTFGTARLQWWEVGWSFRQTGMDGAPLHFARPVFIYHGVTVSLEEKNLEFERMDGNRLIRTRRDPAAENRLLAALAKFKFKPVDSFLMAGVARDKKLAHAWTIPSATSDMWFGFLTEGLAALEAAGWTIEHDPSSELRLAKPQDWYAEVTEDKAKTWFDVELGVQVDGEKINLLPILLRLLQSGAETYTPTALAKLPPQKPILVPLEDGRQLPFPAGRLRDIVSTLIELYDPQALDKKGRLTLPRLRAAEVASMGDVDTWQWLGGAPLKDLWTRLRNFRGLTPVTPPAGLQAELRPYQQEGLTWLQFLREYDLAGILADDMGLGKTIQALAHILVEKDAGRMDRPCLVIAPTSLMNNWRQEAERFAPALKVLVSHGIDRKQYHENLADYDLIVTSYPLLSFDQEVLTKTDFHMVILDEAQYIKNPKTRYAQIACLLKARHRLCLTGTPLENHLGELWSQFNFLLPGFLADETRFRILYRNPIERDQNADRRHTLARRVGPFILRRRKEEVMKELPPKTEIIQQVELDGAQRDLYESIRLAMHAKVRQEILNKGVARSQIVILDALLKLRQVCCDPRLVPIESARRVQESAKLTLLMELLPEMVQEGRRILLFSQFTSMLDLIEPELTQAGIAFVRLSGDTQDRATPVNRFQALEVPVFLISLRAGGTGLNLTAADTVIHYDPWWNPAVENQATDRAHRIGQDKKVFVYKLMTVGTVEEKISALQAKKRELVEGLLNEGAQNKLALSAADLDVLFAPLG